MIGTTIILIGTSVLLSYVFYAIGYTKGYLEGGDFVEEIWKQNYKDLLNLVNK